MTKLTVINEKRDLNCLAMCVSHYTHTFFRISSVCRLSANDIIKINIKSMHTHEWLQED